MRAVGVRVLHDPAIGLQLLRDHDPGTRSKRRFSNCVGLLDRRPSADMGRASHFQAHSTKRSRLLVLDGELVDQPVDRRQRARAGLSPVQAKGFERPIGGGDL